MRHTGTVGNSVTVKASSFNMIRSRFSFDGLHLAAMESEIHSAAASEPLVGLETVSLFQAPPKLLN